MDRQSAALQLLKSWAMGNSQAKATVGDAGEDLRLSLVSEPELSMPKKREIWSLLADVQSVPAKMTKDLVIPR